MALRKPASVNRRSWRLARALCLGLVALAACAGRTPLAAVEAYARAVYARDYGTAYGYLSADDQAVVSQAGYAGQYQVFEGVQLEVAQHLAGFIDFQNPQVVQAGNTATLTAHVRVPDGNAAAVAGILEEAARPGADARALRAQVDALERLGQLPYLAGEQTFELRQAGGRWGVALGLGQAAQVTFTTSVQAGLPWEFEPLQASAHLLPGDVVRAQFRVKNLSDRTLTGKADQNTAPEALAGHLELYKCFCMLQLTLAPGEEQTLTVGLALSEPLPAGQNALEVHYAFYPLEAFPFSPGTR